MVLFMHELNVFNVLNVTRDQLTEHTTNNSCTMTSAQPMSVVSGLQKEHKDTKSSPKEAWVRTGLGWEGWLIVIYNNLALPPSWEYPDWTEVVSESLTLSGRKTTVCVPPIISQKIWISRGYLYCISYSYHW